MGATKKNFSFIIIALLLLGSNFAAGQAPEDLAGEKTIKLFVYNGKGKLMDLPAFLNFIGRADGKNGANNNPNILLLTPDGVTGEKPQLRQLGPLIALSWHDLPRVALNLPWPIPGDGFSTDWADKDGDGFSDGDAVYLNEELAFSQYRLFRSAWLKHTEETKPPYQPSSRAQKLAKQAQNLIAQTKAAKDGPRRAAKADAALKTLASAWELMLYEHGQQIARAAPAKNDLRFGLTLDAELRNRLPDYRWIFATLRQAGVNWVRLVFPSNPQDFTYAREGSFAEYDEIIRDLNAQGIRVMGCVLDSSQWPSAMTPAIYTERVKHLVLHYKDLIPSWEVGNEINGNWLGGAKAPIPLDRVFAIYSAGAAQVKAIDPKLETVATLYWWGPTAPDFDHSLSGWLLRYQPNGFGQNLDVVTISLEVEDNPAGTAFETIFDRVRQSLPEQKIMLGDFEYTQSSTPQGYWWLSPRYTQDALQDLLSFYTPASCAVSNSLCGGFFWYSLEKMFPSGHHVTPLFRAYQHALRQMGR